MKGLNSGKGRDGVNLVIFGLVVFLLAGLGFTLLALRGALTTDMGDQVSFKPQERPLEPPLGSVPVGKTERVLPREVAAKVLRNPVSSTPASLENGKRLYEIYCALCHGPDGKGGGPIAAKFIPPPDLTLPLFVDRTDGFIYETIRSGGPLMPTQGEALAPQERWDIVNYLRKLQGSSKK